MKKTSMKARFIVLIVAAILSAAAVANAAKQPPAQAININQASAAELAAIPGLGTAKAEAIIAYRNVSPFKTTEELVNVKGIGEKLYAKISPYVTVSGVSGQRLPGTAGTVGTK